MKILVLVVRGDEELGQTIPDWRGASVHGNQVWVTNNYETCGFTPDRILSMSVGVMEDTWKALERWPDVPMFCYNWDTYEWVWTRPRPEEYDYDLYGELLRKAARVFVPSVCTRRRVRQWWDLDSEVILASAPYWDYQEVFDGDYALCSLRKIPDKNWDWLEDAMDVAGIPIRMTNHECTWEEYQGYVAGCRFLVSHLWEASTGGLTLLEGLYLGKPCLVSDSPWNGASEYLADWAEYFDHTSFRDFCQKLRWMWDNPPKVPVGSDVWVFEHYSHQRMIDQLLRSIT